MLENKIRCFSKTTTIRIDLPIAIFVFNRPIIQTRNGVRTAVCSIDVLNGIIKTKHNKMKSSIFCKQLFSSLPNSLASPIINGT